MEVLVGEVVRAGKNRGAQVVARGKRTFFKGKTSRDFLEWFAASGNVTWSACKVGVSDKTVWKHRMNDPVFAADFDRAQEQGVARARALLLAGRTKPVDLDGDWVAPELEDFGTDVLLKIVGEDGKRRGGGGRQAGRAPAVASNAEVEAALPRRLAVFSRRARAEAKARGAECPCCGQAFPPAPEAGGAAGGVGEAA